jgi:hypothetical protein
LAWKIKMPIPLIAQEIYLLERFSSLESLADVRDAWEAMLMHVERLYEHFMLNLPSDYRRRPLPQQPDRVWGDRVLPNFRDTMQVLNESVIERSHGDLWAIGGAAIRSDVNGQRDYSSDWMDEVEPGGAARYYELLFHASDLANPVSRTWSGTWSPGDLTVDYDKYVRVPLNPPGSWPIYRLSPTVTVRSGGRTPKSGIYLPDVDRAFPTLLYKHDDPLTGEANEAFVLKTTGRAHDYVPCLWTLVERVADSGGTAGWGAETPTDAALSRCVGGESCPRSGWWFTPAKANSRRYFKAKDIMPDVDSKYGSTIWQWDIDQSNPKL